MTEEIPDMMELWRNVCQTDPDFTKHVNQRGGFTCINAVWQIKQATMQWGAYGDPRWWLDYTWDDLHIGKDLVIMHATFRYPGGNFPITNAVKLGNNRGADEDAFKKLETDTLTKALSKLGFSADIFMGCWDQQKYTSEAPAQTGGYQQQPHNPTHQGYQQ